MILNFAKESGLWYVVLPEWTGDKSELLMVQGADTFLDFIAAGKSKVGVDVETETPAKAVEGWLTLILEKQTAGGGDYRVLGLEHKMWLCAVTKFVFDGKLPKKLYFRKK